ncbi:MAG: hypothetical protein ACKVWR_10645 [Acidimicrobiales bacterium]
MKHRRSRPLDRPRDEAPPSRPPEMAQEMTTRQAGYASSRSAWSPGQLLGLVVGVASTVLGGIALARTGLDFSDVAETHVDVAGLHHTSVLGAVSLVFGLVTIGAAVVPGGLRALMALLGLAALGFGIVVLADSASLHDVFGVHEENGWLYGAYGVVLLIGAALPANSRVRQERTVARR